MKKLFTTCLLLALQWSLTNPELLAAPPKVIVQGSIKPIQTALQDLEGYVIEAVKGTPQAAFVQPGSLTFLGPMMLGLPPGLINMSEGIHVFVLDAKDLKKAPSAMVIPLLQELKDYKGTQLKPAGDIFQWKTKSKTLFLVQAGEGFATLSEDQNHAKAIANYFIHQSPKPVVGENILQLKINLAAMINSHKKDFFAEFDKSIQPLTGKNAKMAKAYLAILKDTLSGLESIDFTLNAKGDQLNLISSVTTLGKGDFTKLIQQCAKLKVDYSDTAYLSSESALFGAFQWDKSLNEAMIGITKKFLLPLSGSDELSGKIISSFESSMKLMNGPMSFSNFSTTSSVSTQTFFNVSDGKAYMDLINPTMTTTMNLINSMYKDMDLPITLDMNITKEKEKVANLEVQKITYKADSSLPTGLENMSQYICNDKNTIYMVSNTSSDPTELNELIQTKRSQKPTLSKREGYQKTLEIVKGQKVGFMSMYPIDYIKTTMQQTKTNAGILAGMLVGLEAVLDKLPKSKHTVTFGFDVPTKNTMSMNMNLPALAVQELMMAGMAVQQHFMTSMQNKKPTK